MIHWNNKYSVTLTIYGLAILTGGGVGASIGSFYGLGLSSGFLIGIFMGFMALVLCKAIKKGISLIIGPEFGGRPASRTLRAELKQSINQAHYLKRNGDFQNALKTVNLIITIDPNFPEALLLKAQILWEGFENHRAANPIIGQVLMMTSKEDAIHQQALWLATDIEDACEEPDRKAAAEMH
jgi:hypothetical protein